MLFHAVVTEDLMPFAPELTEDLMLLNAVEMLDLMFSHVERVEV